jgi:hypothetical protein
MRASTTHAPRQPRRSGATRRTTSASASAGYPAGEGGCGHRPSAVYGDNRSYLVALVPLDPDELEALAEKCRVAADAALMCEDDAVRAAIQAEIDGVNGSWRGSSRSSASTSSTTT